MRTYWPLRDPLSVFAILLWEGTQLAETWFLLRFSRTEREGTSRLGAE